MAKDGRLVHLGPLTPAPLGVFGPAVMARPMLYADLTLIGILRPLESALVLAVPAIAIRASLLGAFYRPALVVLLGLAVIAGPALQPKYGVSRVGLLTPRPRVGTPIGQPSWPMGRRPHRVAVPAGLGRVLRRRLAVWEGPVMERPRPVPAIAEVSAYEASG